MSCDENRPTLRTTTFSPSCSHSSTDPGPIPSFRRISAGTEICPCAVTFDRGADMVEKWCPGTELNRRHEDFQSSALPTELPGHRARKDNTSVLNTFLFGSLGCSVAGLLSCSAVRQPSNPATQEPSNCSPNAVAHHHRQIAQRGGG